MKAILLGQGKMLANMIESARESGIEIAGVFRYEYTSLPDWKRRFQDFFKTSYELTLIKKYKLFEIKCKSANSEEFRKCILKTNADIIMVGTWREKIEKKTFQMPKIGTINIHPSLLPRYRGPNPYMQVILHGEKKTGITLHLMDEEFDTGAILIQKEIDILPTDTGKELREKSFAAARKATAEFFTRIQKDVIIPIQQNEARASYYGNINETMKMLNFKNQTSEEIYATIRALHPWLPCYITIGKNFYKVNPYKVTQLTKKTSTLTNVLIENLINAQEKNTKKTSPKTLPGLILNKNHKTRSLTIVCKDGKALQFEDLKLWGGFLRPFTKHIIKHIIKPEKTIAD